MARMLGEVVRELREEREWSRPRLAEESGVSIATINRLELYDIVPGLDLVAQLAEAFDTTAGALLTQAEESVPPSRQTSRKRTKARK